MPINSRSKGCRAERELAQVFKELFGWKQSHRSQQHCGANGDSDVTVPEIPSLFVEVKHVQKLNLPAAMKKATEQSGEKLPVVCHRRNREQWLITANLKDLPDLVMTLYTSMQEEPSEKPLLRDGT